MSRWVLSLLSCICMVLSPSLSQAADLFVFRDTTKEAGLLPDIGGIRGHAAGWGDANNDGFIDLYVGSFSESGSKPNMFFLNQQGKFKLEPQKALDVPGRPTGALFADLDNDGDLDFYLSNMPKVPKSKAEIKKEKAERAAKAAKAKNPAKGNAAAPKPAAEKPKQPPKPEPEPVELLPCTLFRNDGQGKFTNISEGNGACPKQFGGRSVTVLDYDGDGLLDLLVGEDPFCGKDGKPGYNGSPTKSSRLFHNLGNLQFEDVTQAVGIPAGIPGLGVGVADVNNDTFPDLYLSSSEGGNKLFVYDGHGKFKEATAANEVFAWPNTKGDDMVCGICFGDVNRDGLMDAVVGQHHSYPRQPEKFVADRMFINRGVKDGMPIFEDVTEKVGLVPLPLKGPHVEIQDYDNDGLMDVSVSIAKFANGKTYPLIFKNMGIQNGLPHFENQALGVNDFPNADDYAAKGTTAFFDKMIANHKIVYTAPGPSGDYDNDGRLDLFMANWWLEGPSMLLHNETPGGNWLDVTVSPPAGVNRMGIGSRVNIYPAGKLGQAKELLGSKEIATGYGYASAQPAIAHFGLGKVDSVDVEVILPNKKGKIEQKGVKANQRLAVGSK